MAGLKKTLIPYLRRASTLSLASLRRAPRYQGQKKAVFWGGCATRCLPLRFLRADPAPVVTDWLYRRMPKPWKPTRAPPRPSGRADTFGAPFGLAVGPLQRRLRAPNDSCQQAIDTLVNSRGMRRAQLSLWHAKRSHHPIAAQTSVCCR